MVMRSVNSSVQGRKASAARLAVLIVIVVQALGLGPVWPQEPTQPRLDEEIRQTGKNLPQAGRRCSPRLRHRSGALGLRGASSHRVLRRSRQAWQLGPMAGYRRGRRAGHTGLLRTRRRRAVG